MKNYRVLVVIMFFSAACRAQSGTDAVSLPAISLKAELVVGDLQAPTDMVFPANGTIWVTEQNGKIKVIKGGKVTGVLLDLGDKMVDVNQGYDERGLLGITLHPSFATNKKFYVFYSAPTSGHYDHKGMVVEYKLLPNSENVDAGSARVILSIEEPESNHNGGCIKFGHDGYLYISLGDGGGGGDQHGTIGNGQNLGTWLGKILRVDVNDANNYKIPADNPFVHAAGAKPEIWAYGLRNPYRFSFDKASGQLFAGDVGQNQWEEVDIVTKGANYGWRITEGTHCYNPRSGCDTKGTTMPITEYGHREGVSVAGGYVYNGTHLPALKGRYIFGDWSGPLFYLQNAGGAWQRGKITLDNYPHNIRIMGFAEDPSGEIYLLTNTENGPSGKGCGIYRIEGN